MLKLLNKKPLFGETPSNPTVYSSHMNVLERLGQALSKNGIKSPILRHEEVLLRMFEGSKPSATKKRREVKRKPVAVSKNATVKDNIALIGRKSNFQKKVVREYLSPLQAHPFSRHQIKNDFDADKATRMNKWAKKIAKSKNSQTLLFGSSQQFIGDMLAALVSCSPKDVMANSEEIVRSFPNYTMSEVPRIPNFNANPQLFEEYIGLLSHTTFLYKNSSSTNGIVPKILRNLMHPANIKTLYLRTTRNYNDMMYYFSEKFDFATCRELLVQMKIEGVSPNTVTYNLMLRAVLKNSHIRKTKLPDNEVLYYLRNMGKMGVKADSITWTTCYNFLKEDISRTIFIEQMQERNIPITEDFVYTVLRNGTYKSNECLKFLTNNTVPLVSKLFRLCIERLIKENRINIAWVFLDYTLKKKSRDFTVGAKILNVFLRAFAENGRLDMAIMTFNTCTQDYGIKPDTHSFEMLFKALTKNGYTKHFPTLLQYLKNLRISFGLGNRTNFWLLKASSISKFNLNQKKTVSHDKVKKAESLLKDLKWGYTSSGFTDKPWKENGPKLKKIYRYLGCIPMPLKDLQRSSTVGRNTAHISAKKAKYRSRIRYIALQNAMLKRIPYSKDWYGALKRELQERHVSVRVIP